MRAPYFRERENFQSLFSSSPHNIHESTLALNLFNGGWSRHVGEVGYRVTNFSNMYMRMQNSEFRCRNRGERMVGYGFSGDLTNDVALYCVSVDSTGEDADV